MRKKTCNSNFVQGYFESSRILDKYYSVQFSINDCDPVYIFKLRDSSNSGLCILVKEDSNVLKCLKVNETIDMQYNPSASQETGKFMKTKISDIRKNNYEGFSGHCLVQLSIMMEEHDDHL